MRRLAVLIIAAISLAACSSSGGKPAPTAQVPGSSSQGGTTSSTASYNPKIDPANFSATITNPYQPWQVGRRWVYDGTKDGQLLHVIVTVTRETKTILGVKCVVIRDVVTVNNTLEEKTVDWYAQDAQGNVWYFGEDTAEYVNGVVSSTAGTWEAGVDGAEPGIVMPATPTVGKLYQQEYRPGIAEDRARVLSVTAVQRLSAGTFRNVVETDDIDPLTPAKKEHKWFAKGIGAVHIIRTGAAHTEALTLTSYSH